MSNTAMPDQHGGYSLPSYEFTKPPELLGRGIGRYPVVIVGAGLSGLSAACDLAVRGIETVVIDEDNTVGVRGASSRGICYAQKTLEIFDRLGIYQRIRDRGVTWAVGKTLVDEEVVYSFDLAIDSASLQPPFINLQQFYIEWFLVDRIQELGRADLRWQSKVTGVRQTPDRVTLSVDTPAGAYTLDADWVIDASGLNSAVRQGLGLSPHTFTGHDRWCISDVRFEKPYPAERWTWVKAPANDGRAVWQHLMADGVWRLDFQMTPDADPEAISTPEVVSDRLRRHLGKGVDFELVWVGPYSYRSQLLDDFRCGRVFFIGDAAHVMSPFGARGGNSGVQDAENLVWKLALVLAGKAPAALLDSYDAERRPAADHNIRFTQRTDRFLSPWSPQEHIVRNAVIALARRYRFARGLVNTGRLSVPYVYADSPVVSTGGQAIQNMSIVLPGGKDGHLVDLFRDGTALLAIAPEPVGAADGALAALRTSDLPIQVYRCDGVGGGTDCIGDASGALARQLGAGAGTIAVLRPDMHLAALIERPGEAAATEAVRRALGHGD